MNDTPFSLATIHEEFERVRDTLFSGTASVVRWRPLLDLAQGDVTTDLCVQLAGELRREPSGIAKEMHAALGPDTASLVSVVDGFLNVRGTTDAVWLRKIESTVAEKVAASTVVVAPREPMLEGWSHLRLVFSAVLQFYHLHVLGIPARFYLGSSELFSSNSKYQLGVLCREAMSACAERQRDTHFVDTVRSLAHETVTRRTLWLSTRSIPTNVFAELTSTMRRDGAGVDFIVRKRPWLSPITLNQQPHEVVTWSDAELTQLCFLFAGPLHADELDLHVATAAEKSNLPWFLRSISERVTRFRVESKRGADDLIGLSAIERELLVRRKFLRDMYFRAAAFGEVLEYLTYIRDLAEGFNRYFNSPDLRRRLDQGAITSHEREIISGISEELQEHLDLAAAPWPCS